MERHDIEELLALQLMLPSSVATIGVFDGLHLGHRTIIDRVVDSSRRRDVPAVCVTFSVHPRSVLGQAPPHQIVSLDHRLELLAAAGIDHTVVIAFSRALAATEPEAFVEHLLVRRLNACELVIGHDTAIGKGRRGDATFLAEAGRRHGFEVVALGEVRVDGQLVSSTAVRNAVAAGDLAVAERLLGRPMSLLGTIVHGDGRGATIGFPTANLEVTSEAFPPFGVYAVTARCSEGDLPAVMNYGLRPTFHQDTQHGVFEVHVLDGGDHDLYGQRMEVFLHAFLRREQRFEGVDDLVAQIARDVADAREAPRTGLPPR